MELSTVLSILAIVVASLSLYLQRRDKKPRLRIDFERLYFPMAHIDDKRMRPAPSLTVCIRNPTERTIKIDKTWFEEGKNAFTLPAEWKTVDEVPSHDRRTFVIPVVDFQNWATALGIAHPEKGRFVIIDALNNEYKTEKLGDSLSVEPVDKLS